MPYSYIQILFIFFNTSFIIQIRWMFNSISAKRNIRISDWIENFYHILYYIEKIFNIKKLHNIVLPMKEKLSICLFSITLNKHIMKNHWKNHTISCTNEIKKPFKKIERTNNDHAHLTHRLSSKLTHWERRDSGRNNGSNLARHWGEQHHPVDIYTYFICIKVSIQGVFVHMCSVGGGWVAKSA